MKVKKLRKSEVFKPTVLTPLILATFNKSEANYVNQTKVIRYCVIAKVRGSRKHSDSKPCDYTRRSKPCDYTHRSKPSDYTRRSKPCDYTRRSKQKRYIHCSFNKSQNQCFSIFFAILSRHKMTINKVKTINLWLYLADTK